MQLISGYNKETSKQSHQTMVYSSELRILRSQHNQKVIDVLHSENKCKSLELNGNTCKLN